MTLLAKRERQAQELHGETLAAATVCREQHRWGPVVVTDLAAGGATLTGPLPPMSVGTRVRVLLQLENRRRPIRLWARVRGWRHDHAGGRCRVAFEHRYQATEEALQQATLLHLERLHARLPVVLVLDSGRLLRSDLGRDLLALGYNPLFFGNMLDAIWWAEDRRSACSNIVIDASFLYGEGTHALEFLAEFLPAPRRLLAVRGPHEVPQALFGTVHGILGVPWHPGALRAALAPTKTLFAPRRILFVDDEPKILAGLQGRLRRDLAGWHSAWATSGEAALAEFRAAPFDVVVTDVRMPGMDGIELLATIKRTHPRVRGVVLSGYETALPNRVADVVLRKPCPMSVLRQAALGI